MSCSISDPSGLLYTLLEELSPAAMAAFDLACCHCQLWKTSRQLLDTAERRLNSSLEARGMQPVFKDFCFVLFFLDCFVILKMYIRWCRLYNKFILMRERTYNLKSLSASLGVRASLKVTHSDGICGFPMVLQQITKILNHSTTNKGSIKTGE